MTSGGRTVLALALVGLGLVAVPTAVAATSSTVSGIGAVVIAAVGTALVWTVALLMWMRPADRRISYLLFAVAVGYAVRCLAASDNAWVFTVARLLGPVDEFLLAWVMLAFPSGRLRSRRDRVIVIAAGVVTTVLWLPALLFAPDIPFPGPLVPCDTNCPRNTLLVSDSPVIRSVFENTFRWVSAALLVAVALSLLDRLLQASPVTRRTLTPLLVVSVLRTVALAVFVLTNGSVFADAVPITLFWAVPLSMALGLVLGRMYTAAALLRLVSGLQRRPDATELRTVIADALDDPDLQIAYWLPDHDGWAGPGGTVQHQPPAARPGRAVTVATLPHGQPLAALVHDEALLEQPALLDAVTASTRMALESNRVETDLALSDARVADAQDLARRDLERDLHDGAQQRLIALRMKVSVLTRLMSQDVRRAARLVDELGPDLEAALAEIRDIARGAPSRLLVSTGLEAALADAALTSGMASLTAERVGRYPPAVESAVYFTCMEALQNAAKHSPPGTEVLIRLEDDGRALTFSVHNESLGAGSTLGPAGHGLTNMSDRMTGCGGELVVDTDDVGTVTVRGRVPRT